MTIRQVTDLPRLTSRARDAHKGNFGKVLIIGGSVGMVGAPALAANAAFRCGAGLVRLAVGRSIWQTVATLAPCATSIPLAEDTSGKIGSKALRSILNAVGEHDAIALGPGLGQSGQLQEIVGRLLAELACPLVVDADGLNNLAALGSDILPRVGCPRHDGPQVVLTPHVGEMKRLWNAWRREEPPKDRCKWATELAKTTGAIVVLKGAGTVVADGERVYVNSTGNPGMATGGSGDVLTGCISGLLGQKIPPFEAAILGVFIHGRAGDIMAEQMGEISLMATDIVDGLSKAWKEFSEKR
ncbi:MAG: NAD(P)H-hydrate dehydratase [Sedimentisphaerales bacterium]|nr:NAD(P)H-hydrate dehydratase [Sedimentisphaerales bacterium]